MPNSLDVNVDDTLVGNLTSENDIFIFSYTKEDAKFISLTMPRRKEQYLNKKLHPIFEMHLPEGYLLSIIKKHFSKFTKTDDFGLLQLMSENINTRITYNKNTQKVKNSFSLDELLHPTSKHLFEELVSRFALNSALSGVQPKVLASIEDKATLKYNDYIVKSWGDEYPQLALNEYYCMKLVKYANINVAEFYISDDDRFP